MFETHFALRENPFVSGHQPKFVYPSPEHQEALAHLRFGIENREPFVLITGEVGTGKTTALYDVLDEWKGRVHVALITNSALTRGELLEEICLRLGFSLPQGSSKPQILSQLERHLLAVHARSERAILLLDEAQNLERDLLEEIRLLSNLEFQGDKLLQVFLVGQPELEERLARAELRQLRQRISVHYRLNPLGPEDTERYIHHRISVAGGYAPGIFPSVSCRDVYALSHGIPREINQICAQAMLGAFVDDSRVVHPEHVRAAAAEIDFRSVLPEGGAGSAPATPTRSAMRPVASLPRLDPELPPAQGPHIEPPPALARPVASSPPVATSPSSPGSIPPFDLPRPEQTRAASSPPPEPAGESTRNVLPPRAVEPPLPPRVVEPVPPPRVVEPPPVPRAVEPPPVPRAVEPPPVPRAVEPVPPRRVDEPPPVPRAAPPLTVVEQRFVREPRQTTTPTPNTVEDLDDHDPSAATLKGLLVLAAVAAVAIAGVLLFRFKPWSPTRTATPPAHQAGEAPKSTPTESTAQAPPPPAATPVGPPLPATVPTSPPQAAAESAPAPPKTAANSRPAPRPAAANHVPAPPKASAASAHTPRKSAAASPHTPPKTPAPSTTRAASAAPPGLFSVAVGTYLDQARAEAERGRLETTTKMPARVLAVTQDSVARFELVLGSFKSQDAAERAASDLIARGLVDEARVVAQTRPPAPVPH